jgi:hypothetical protein
VLIWTTPILSVAFQTSPHATCPSKTEMHHFRSHLFPITRFRKQELDEAVERMKHTLKLPPTRYVFVRLATPWLRLTCPLASPHAAMVMTCKKHQEFDTASSLPRSFMPIGREEFLSSSQMLCYRENGVRNTSSESMERQR